jgi:hypothetical protein
MTSTICDEAVLRADRVGRVRVGEERRLALLEEFDRSHLSAQAFAELVGVRYSTFAGWIQRRRASRGVKTSSAWSGSPIKLVEAVLDSCVQHPLPALVVELGGGAKVEVRSREQLALVAELLGHLSGRTGQPARVC